MKRVSTAVAAASLLLAGAGAVAAQQIDPICAAQAAAARVATTHNVIYDSGNNICVATLLGSPMFGTPGFAGVGAGTGAGAAGALGSAGGVLAASVALVVIGVAVTGGT